MKIKILEDFRKWDQILMYNYIFYKTEEIKREVKHTYYVSAPNLVKIGQNTFMEFVLSKFYL